MRRTFFWLTIALCCAIVALVSLYEPMVAIFATGVVGFFIYALYLDNKNKPALEYAQQQQEVMRINNIYYCLYMVISKVSNVLCLQPPSEPDDIIADPQIIIKDGFQFVRCSVLKKSVGIAEDEYLHNAIKILQTTINRGIKSGLFNGLIPFGWLDNRKVPYFVVDDVKDNGAYLEIEVAIADTVEICDYLCAKRHKKAPAVTVNRNDEEF